MPAIDMSALCIPAECDNIKLPIDGEVASRWDAYCYATFCRHFASAMLHFASLITHNLRCIPAYAHQIPTGFFQSLLNYHRNNLYIISPNTPPNNPWDLPPTKKISEICVSQRKHKTPHNPWDLPPTKKSVRVRSVWAKEKKSYFSSRSATA